MVWHGNGAAEQGESEAKASESAGESEQVDERRRLERAIRCRHRCGGRISDVEGLSERINREELGSGRGIRRNLHREGVGGRRQAQLEPGAAWSWSRLHVGRHTISKRDASF